MKLQLKRFQGDDKQTLGEMDVLDDSGAVVFSCKTLELAWKDNQRRISCIPTGTYPVKRRHSEKFKEHFHITEVPDRDWILIHAGNFYTQIMGCVLVGETHTDINNDGYRDVTGSKNTMAKLLEILPNDGFELTIEGP